MVFPNLTILLSLLKKFQNLPKIEIGNELNQNQIDDTQVVILDEDDFFFNISFPKNEELRKLVKSFNGFWRENIFCWGLPITKKLEMIKKCESLNYSIKVFEKPIHGKKY